MKVCLNRWIKIFMVSCKLVVIMRYAMALSFLEFFVVFCRILYICEILLLIELARVVLLKLPSLAQETDDNSIT